MSLDNIRSAGPNSVPAYQLSGVPFVTSSSTTGVSTTPVKISFPYVTRFVIVKNLTANELRVGFSANGVSGTNYFVVAASATTPEIEVRCKEIFFQRNGGTDTGFSLLAGLTGINSDQFPVLTGSAEFQGIG